MNPLLLSQGAAAAPPGTTPLFNVPVSNGRENAPAAVDFSSIPDANVPEPRRQGRHDGVQGVARDILGTLGDFLLTRLRLPAMYAPAQRQRRLNEAFEGFEQNPEEAIRRVTEVDFTQGQRLREQNVDNQRLAAAQASTAEAREARLQLQRDAAAQRGHAVVSGLLNTLSGMSEEDRRRNYPMMRDRARAAAAQRGLTLSPQEVPDNYDPIALDAYLNSNVPVGTQRTQLMNSKNREIVNDLAADRLDETVRHNQAGEGDRDADRDARVGVATMRDGTTRDIATMRDGTSRRNTDVRAQTTRDVTAVRDRTANRGLDVRQRGQEINPRGRTVPRIPREGKTRRVNGRIYVIRNGRPVPQ